MRTIQQIDQEYSQVAAQLGDAVAKQHMYGELCRQFGERATALLIEGKTLEQTPAPAAPVADEPTLAVVPEVIAPEASA